ANQSAYDIDKNNFMNTIGSDINLLNNELKLHGDLSYIYNKDYTNRWWDNTGPYISHNFNNRNTILDYYSDAGPAKVIKDNAQYRKLGANIYAKYAKSFNIHDLEATAGVRFESYKYHSENIQHEDPITGLDEHSINLATGEYTASDGDDKYANASLFMRLNYHLKDRYLLEFNGMQNTSSKFRKGNRGAFFGSVSAAWRISEEPFFSSLEQVINELKV